jgi:hypothetical protein
VGHATQDVLRSFIELGQVWRAEHSAMAVAAAGVSYLGFVTSNVEMEALARNYGSSGNILLVELFEATFTGGTNVRTLNRKFSVSTPPPIQFKTGITPGALTTALTSTRVLATTSTGSAQVGVFPDSSLVLLKANTSYVLRMTNASAGVADLGASIDYREAL